MNRPFILSSALVSFALGSALALAGCGERASYALVEGFETVCPGNIPCNWSVQAGSTGTASYNETLPGEHGLLLVGGPMAVLRETPGVELGSSWDAGGLNADLAARCDDRSTLTIEVTVENRTTGAPVVVTGIATPPLEWDGTLDTVNLRTGDFSSPFFTDVLAVRIVKSGTGTCELDYFALRLTTGFGFEG